MQPGQRTFEAYNSAGANPGKTHDGKSVPDWSNLTDDVRAKWAAAEKEGGKVRLDAFGGGYSFWMIFDTFMAAFKRYDAECAAHNGGLSLRVLLECWHDEIGKRVVSKST